MDADDLVSPATEPRRNKTKRVNLVTFFSSVDYYSTIAQYMASRGENWALIKLNSFYINHGVSIVQFFNGILSYNRLYRRVHLVLFF